MHAEDRNMQLTIILILISTSYVLAYIPVLLHFVMYKIQLSGLIPVSFEALDIVGNYSRALYVAGFAINFFLYTVSGRVFRDQLRKIVCCGGPRNELDAGMTMNTVVTHGRRD